MSQENTDGKKSIGICLSVISCVLLYFFPLLKVYPSQCSALRMHTCGATMIHIITTFGDDSNQKPEVQPANNLKRPDSQRRDLHSCERARQKYTVQFWKEMSAYLRVPLSTKHTRVESTKITGNALQINKYS